MSTDSSDNSESKPPVTTPLKRGRGRPTSFKPEYIQRVYDMARFGAIDRQIASNFGITEQNFALWKNKYPELLESLHRAKDELDGEVELSLFKRAMGYSHPEEKVFFGKDNEVIRVTTTKHYPPDAACLIFWLKNRRPLHWRDQLHHALQADIRLTVDAPRESMEEWLKRVEEEERVKAIDVTPPAG